MPQVGMHAGGCLIEGLVGLGVEGDANGFHAVPNLRQACSAVSQISIDKGTYTSVMPDLARSFNQSTQECMPQSV